MNNNLFKNNAFSEPIFHVLFWLIFIHFIFDIGGLFHSLGHIVYPDNEPYFDEAFIMLPIAIALFYWNLSFLIPRYLNLGKWVAYSIYLILSFIFLYFFAVVVYTLINRNGYYFGLSKTDLTDMTVQMCMQILIASTAVGIGKLAYRNFTLKKKAEEGQKEAELKYLANQFNPHFLFNTLNGIYAKAIEEEAIETTEAILMLSDIMRYPIHQGLQKNVLIEEEIKFIQQYITLQKVRLGDDYPIGFEIHGDLKGVRILPLSLIVLVENAIKYGVSQNTKSPIRFILNTKENHLQFTSRNSFKLKDGVHSHKIGLENLNARLSLSYQKDYSLEFESDGNTFMVELKINSL